MKKNFFEYENLPENFDLEVLTQKITEELTAMGYAVKETKADAKTELWLEKDIAPMEIFLGRWQRLRASFSQNKGRLSLSFDKKDVADKVVCYIVGAFFFFIPYIFCFIATGNRNETQKVIEKIVSDYISKRKNELEK